MARGDRPSESITVVGRLPSNPYGACIGYDCAVYPDLYSAIDAVLASALPQGVLGAFIDWLYTSVPISTCIILTNNELRNVTSLDASINRQRAAGAAMISSRAGANTLWAHKQDYAVTFSDGGTETWQWNTANPAAPLTKGDLKAGDGVSKCNP